MRPSGQPERALAPFPPAFRWRCGGAAGNRNFILLVLYFTLPALAGWVVRDWMPAILQKSLQHQPGQGRRIRVLYWQDGGAHRRHSSAAGWRTAGCGASERGRIYVSAIGMMLIVPAMFGVGNAGTLNSFASPSASLILFGLGWGFFDCNNMPILSQIARPSCAPPATAS
jgi:hypothetical protein